MDITAVLAAGAFSRAPSGFFLTTGYDVDARCYVYFDKRLLYLVRAVASCYSLCDHVASVSIM